MYIHMHPGSPAAIRAQAAGAQSDEGGARALLGRAAYLLGFWAKTNSIHKNTS